MCRAGTVGGARVKESVSMPVPIASYSPEQVVVIEETPAGTQDGVVLNVKQSRHTGCHGITCELLKTNQSPYLEGQGKVLVK